MAPPTRSYLSSIVRTRLQEDDPIMMRTWRQIGKLPCLVGAKADLAMRSIHGTTQRVRKAAAARNVDVDQSQLGAILWELHPTNLASILDRFAWARLMKMVLGVTRRCGETQGICCGAGTPEFPE